MSKVEGMIWLCVLIRTPSCVQVVPVPETPSGDLDLVWLETSLQVCGPYTLYVHVCMFRMCRMHLLLYALYSRGIGTLTQVREPEDPRWFLSL